MIKFAWDMYKKYEEAVNYLFFGFLAFVVNMAAYALAAWGLHADDEKVALVLIGDPTFTSKVIPTSVKS